MPGAREKFPILLPQMLLLLGFAVLLVLNFPGQISYDTVIQLAEARSGHYGSWHPPVMAWLMGLGDTVLRGTGVYLLFTVSLLLAAWLALLRSGRTGWSTIVILAVILATPQMLLLQGEVWKDMLFANAAAGGFCFLAAAGARWPIARPRFLLLALCALLLGLAALARQNGLVVVPVAALAAGLIARRNHASPWRYGFGLLAAIVALVIVGNAALGLRGDDRQGMTAQLREALTFDLAGILHADPSIALPILKQKAPYLEAALRKDGIRLYSPHLMDTLEASPALMDAVNRAPPGILLAQWRQAVVNHPGAYLRHRLPAFRWIIAPPDIMTCHPAVIGVGGPADVMKSLDLAPHKRKQDLVLYWWAQHFFHTPIYSHLFYGALAVLSLIVLARRGAPADLAIAGLQAAAILFTLSFFFLAVACDYRYLYFLDLAALTGVLQCFCRPQEFAPQMP
jgi:hypothetical protein